MYKVDNECVLKKEKFFEQFNIQDYRFFNEMKFWDNRHNKYHVLSVSFIKYIKMYFFIKFQIKLFIG